MELLEDSHDIREFDCAESTSRPDIMRFLTERARLEQAQRRSATHVLHFQNDNRVRAFITLALGSLFLDAAEVETAPAAEEAAQPTDGQKKERPKKMRVPSLHIAYVATCKTVDRLGWGHYLISWAIGQAVKLQDQFGCRYVHLECYEDKRSTYEAKGFKQYKVENDPELKVPRYSMRYDILAALQQANAPDAAARAAAEVANSEFEVMPTRTTGLEPSSPIVEKFDRKGSSHGAT